MLAVDDGIASGHLDVADIFFLIGLILGFLAAICAFLAWPKTPPSPSRAAAYAPALAYAAIGCIAMGWFLL